MADFKKSVDALQFIKDLSMPQQAGKIIKASDAYAPFADQGIFTAPTMADRTIASPKGKLKGGMRFPYLQNVDPAYEGEVWGFGAGNMSTRLLNQFENVPSDKLLLSTILGNKYMHHSNPEVSAELIKHYRKGIKDKKLSNELRDVTNRRINQLTDEDKNPIFAPDSDVTDPAFYRSLDTFDKRAAMGNIMGGVGLNEGTERKRRTANQIFDYEGLMRKMTEPSIIGAPNSSIGSRIFTLSGTKSERPDLNKAYPHVVGGLDLNVDFGQVPFQHYLKDYTDNMMQTKGKVPGWFNLTRSSDLPTQEITDQWLQHLKDKGYADGGQVEHMQAGGVKKAIGALGELTQAAPKKITHGMLRRHGMEIGNKEEADALYSSGHRIFGMHELDEVPFEITDRKLFDSYAPDMMLAYPPDKPILKADGGSVEHMQHGGVMPRAGIYYPTSSDERSQAAGLPADFYRKGMTDVASHGYHAGVDIPAGDARLTADLMGSRYVSPYMNKDSINALRLGAEFPMGEGRLRAELMKGLSPNVPTNVGLRYSRPFAEGGQVEHMQAGGAMKLLEEFKALKTAQDAARLTKATSKADEFLQPVKWLPVNEPYVKPSIPQAQGRLSQAEYDANLARFLEGSTLEHPLYHSTGAKILPTEPLGFSAFNPRGSQYRSEMGSHFGTTDQANAFGSYTGQRILPVHLSAKNPLRLIDQGGFGNQQVGDQLFDMGILTNRDRARINDMIQRDAGANDIQTLFQQHLKGHGIDSIKYLNRHEGLPSQPNINNAIYGNLSDEEFLKRFPMARDSHIVFDPTQVKSAIGNRGTFDPKDPDMTKAEGGAVHLQMGGKTPEPPGGSARLETFEAQHMEEGGDIMRQLFDHALDKGDIHEMTHAMLVKQHEAEHG